MKISKFSHIAMIGHICSDINQGALPALLPFLILIHGFSYTMAAGLIFAVNLVSAIIQPLFGYLGDRVAKPWLMGLGVFLASSGMGIIGFLDSYWAIFSAAMVSGIGIALFHPEGGRIANLAAGDSKGTGMSIFAVGGNIGFAIGPIIIAGAVAAFGMQGTALLFIPATLYSVWIFLERKNLTSLAGRHEETVRASGTTQDRWSAFSLVAALLSLRSIVYYALTTFIPLFTVSALVMSESIGSVMLVIFSVAGAIATLAGGRIADSLSFRQVIIGAAAILTPALVFFALSPNIAVSVLMVILLAIGIDFGYSTLVAQGQKFLPSRLGLASGISYGVAVCVGGLFAPVIGLIGDNFGLIQALMVVAIVSFVAFLLSFALPKSEDIKARLRWGR